MPRTVILGAARTPFGRLGGGLASPARAAAGHRRRQRRAGARRRQPRPGRLRGHGRGAAGRRRHDPVASGLGRSRLPGRRRLRHDQQGLRVGHAGGRLRRPADPRRRPRGGAGGRHGEHVQRPLPGAQGPLRLHDGRRRAGRPHDQRRPHLHLHAPDHGRGELGRLGRDRRARGRIRTRGRCAATSAPWRPIDAGHLADEIVAGDGARPQGRHRGRRRRGPAPRHVGRAAGGAEARVQQGRRHHRRKRARGERRRRRAGAGVGGVGRGSRG